MYIHTYQYVQPELTYFPVHTCISCSHSPLALHQVADFGLAVKMNHMETHISNTFQVRGVHMGTWVDAWRPTSATRYR